MAGNCVATLCEMLTDINHRRIVSVGDSVGNDGMAGKCSATLCEIPTDNIRG